MIGEAVWKSEGIQDVVSIIIINKILRKNDGPDEMQAIMSTFNKYGEK
jgi:hypothetical protein